MKEAGEILKKARESKNLSLHEIGMALKINPKILQAIENGDEDKLPQRTFLRGFIKSYAQYLKLDAEEVIKAGLPARAAVAPMPEPAQAAAISAEATKAAPPKAMERTARLDNLKAPPPTPRRGLYIILGLALLIAVGLVARLVNKYQRERKTEPQKLESILPAAPASPAFAAAATAEDLLAPHLEAKDKTENPVSSAAPPDAPSVPVASPPPTPSPQPVAVAQPAVVPAPAPAVKTEAPSTTNSDAAPAAKPQEVIVEALNRVSISYNLGDEKTAVLEMNADEIHTFKSKTTIRIRISDGGAVNLIVNGRERGVPGKIGKPLELNYPK